MEETKEKLEIKKMKTENTKEELKKSKADQKVIKEVSTKNQMQVKNTEKSVEYRSRGVFRKYCLCFG